MTPKEIIAHYSGEIVAEAIIVDLNAAGFVIVEQHSVEALFKKTMERADEIRRQSDERRAEIRLGARQIKSKFKL